MPMEIFISTWNVFTLFHVNFFDRHTKEVVTTINSGIYGAVGNRGRALSRAHLGPGAVASCG